MTLLEGVETFHRIVALGTEPQVVVSTGNLQTRINQWINRDVFRDRDPDKKEEGQLYDRPHLQTPFVAPRDETEQRLAGIWQQLLGIHGVGIQDDFFELGGDSLLVTQVISRIRSQLGVKLPFENLFEDSTIARLAERIKTVTWALQELDSPTDSPTEDREEFDL